MTHGHFRGCFRFSFAELKKPAIYIFFRNLHLLSIPTIYSLPFFPLEWRTYEFFPRGHPAKVRSNLKYAYNLLVFSRRCFSVRELSAVSVLYFWGVLRTLQRSHNVSFVFPTFLRTMTCSYKVNCLCYSSWSDRNGKQRRELHRPWEFALNAHSILYSACEDL